MSRRNCWRIWIEFLLLVTLWAVSFFLRPRPVVAAEETPQSGPRTTVPCMAPDGFEVVLAAGPPLVERPLFATFDDEGRLYVVDSGGINGDDRGQQPPDTIRCLTDNDGDGIFDRSQVFADKIVFGTGLSWYDGALFLCSPPSLWRLEDSNGDGRADRRRELVTGFAFNQSCSDDAHGACLGPDGRIYFLPGRFPHEIRAPSGPLLRKGVGPWLMRCRADGSEIEFVSGCVGNPVEVAFLPSGEMFAQGTYWAKPSMGSGLRDALVHVVEGAEYSVRDRDYTDRIRTGDLLPALVPMSATAPSGCMIYRGNEFGMDDRQNLFGSYFNTGRIVRYELRKSGATFLAEPKDFLVGTAEDLHFTDVLEDADGSLLAVNTGGWFRRCCPTSKIAKPSILGGIYRVRHIASDAVSDPRGLQLDWSQLTVPRLIDLLDDNRFAVRDRAMEQLRRTGADAIDALAGVLTSAAKPTAQHAPADASSPRSASVRQRIGAVWTLCRIDDPNARVVSRVSLHDPDEEVRQAAVASAALHRDGGSLSRLLAITASDGSLAVRRGAANALGRIGDAKAVPSLLALLKQTVTAGSEPNHPGDSAEPTAASAAFLDHAAVLALIRIGDAEATRAGLQSEDAGVQRGALIALDQMPGDNLRVDEVTHLVSSTSPPLQRAAVAILIQHKEWSESVAGFLDAWLLSDEPWTAERQQTLRETLRAFGDTPAVQRFVEQQLSDAASLPPTSLRELLGAVGACGLAEAPSGWQGAIGRLLSHDDESVCLAAVRAIESLKLIDAVDMVRPLLGNSSLSATTRIAAVRCGAVLTEKISDQEFALLYRQLDPSVPVAQRLAALEVFEAVRPDVPQLLQLTAYVSQSGPVEIPHLLRAFAGCDSEAVGRKLVTALDESSAAVSTDLLAETLKSYPAGTRELAAPLMERLRAEADHRAERLAEFQTTLGHMTGSAQRGRELFFNKTNCYLCHQVENRGGTIGPDLSSIGAIRSQRDLLEAVLAPSASFARGYEPVSVILTDGRIVDGLMGRETPSEIILNGVQDNKPLEIRLARNQIDELNPGRISLMPEGLERQLTMQELSDLIAFLTSLRRL